MVDEVERELLPGVTGKPLILSQRFDAELAAVGLATAIRCIICQPHRLADGFFHQLKLLARRTGKIDHPIEVGLGNRGRRNAKGEARHEVVAGAVHGLGKSRRKVIVTIECSAGGGGEGACGLGG